MDKSLEISSEYKHFSHLVSWEWTSLPIQFGGMRIGSFKQRNNAIILKWLWRFAQEEVLWKRVVASIGDLEPNDWATSGLV